MKNFGIRSLKSLYITLAVILGVVLVVVCFDFLSRGALVIPSNACEDVFGCTAEEFFDKEFDFEDIIHIEDAKNEKNVHSMLANPQDLNNPELFYGVFEGNAGHTAKVFNFGISPYGSQLSYNKILLNNENTGKQQVLDSHLVQFKDLIMTAATRKKSDGQIESLMNADLGILSSHSYACSLKIINEKPYMKVINPHNSSSPLLLNLETFRKLFYSITVNNV